MSLSADRKLNFSKIEIEIFSKFTSNIWDNEKIHKNKKEGHY